MKKFAVVALSSLLAASVATEAFSQDIFGEKRKRKPSFFEKLFGADKPRRQERRRAWWEEDDGGLYGSDTPRNKKSVVKKAVAKPVVKRAAPVVPIDPEVAAGHGMGNLDYSPLRLASLVDTGIAKLATSETDQSAIRLVLSDKSSTIRATQDVRDAVLEHYKTTNFKPLWTSDGNINSRGLAVLDLLGRAGEEGLEPLRYKPAVLESFDGAVAALDGDTLGLAQFDVGLTVAAVTYALHQSGGAFEAEALSKYYDVKSFRASPAIAVKVLAYTPFPAEYLHDMTPKHPAYDALKKELAGLVEPQKTDPQFEKGKRIRIGQKDTRIVMLRERLLAEGFISVADATVADEKKNVLDKVLARALKKYQEKKGIAQSSNLDNATVEALNGPDQNEQRDKIIASMERLRWLPDDLGTRHVFVNQAAQQLTVMDKGKLIWSTNVVVGKPLTQTNAFSHTFEDIVVNPTWTMPQGIFLRDYLPQSRKAAGYIDKKGYKIFDKNGKVVSSRNISWNSVGANSSYRIVQPPGDSNSLGNLKFDFPNRHAIYLHDTPQKELFAEDVRVFSNGCVRVENPKELAEVLLGMDRKTLDKRIASGKTQSVKVPGNTRVHLYYFTAWPDENGKIQYFPDSYGRDASLTKARKLMFKLAGGTEGEKIVVNQAADVKIRTETQQ